MQLTQEQTSALWGALREASKLNDHYWGREILKWLLSTPDSERASVYFWQRWPKDTTFRQLLGEYDAETDDYTINIYTGYWSVDDYGYLQPASTVEKHIPLWPVDVVISPWFSAVPVRTRELSLMQRVGFAYWGWLNEIRIWPKQPWATNDKVASSISQEVVYPKGYVHLWLFSKSQVETMPSPDTITQVCELLEKCAADGMTPDDMVIALLSARYDRDDKAERYLTQNNTKILPAAREAYLLDAWLNGDLVEVDRFHTMRMVEAGNYKRCLLSDVKLNDAKKLILDECAARWAPIRPDGTPHENNMCWQLEVLTDSGEWLDVLRVEDKETMLSCFVR